MGAQGVNRGAPMFRGRQIQLMLTASRALESNRPAPLLIDPFAEPLVQASGDPYARGLLATPLTEPPSGEDDARTIFLTRSRALMTRHYDESLLGAARSGARQVVLLAGGLDTRAYRLPWPEGTVVFEVDYPELLDFKTKVLSDAAAAPQAERRQVGTFLSGAWQSDLTAVGFDPDLPTAWLAEALVSHLPGPLHDALFERVIEMSALGSTIATDTDGLAPSGQSWADVRDALAPEQLRASELSFWQAMEARTRSGEWLSGHGWLTETITGGELADRYHQQFTGTLAPHFEEFAERRFLNAQLPVTYLY